MTLARLEEDKLDMIIDDSMAVKNQQGPESFRLGLFWASCSMHDGALDESYMMEWMAAFLHFVKREETGQQAGQEILSELHLICRAV